jgi:hypothetical protein
LHNNYHPHCSNVNLFWFHGTDRYPAVVAKVFQSPGLPSREFENQSRASTQAPFCVPKPLYFGQHGNRFWAVWMEGVRGFPLSERETRDRDTITSVAATIARMHAAFGLAPVEVTRYARLVEQPVNALRGCGDAKAVLNGCENLLRECSPEWLRSVPAVPQHGDLFSGNVVGERTTHYILDWETLNEIDLPFYDMITLLLSCLGSGGKNPEQWDRTMQEQTTLLLSMYAERLNLSPGDVRLLLPLTLVNWSYIHLKGGRANFSRRLYSMLASYFANRVKWEKVFVPGGA